MTDLDKLAKSQQMFPDAKRKNGQPASEFTKRARRAINEAKAAMRAVQVDLLIAGATGDKDAWRRAEEAFARHRQAGVQQGLDMAAEYIQSNYPFDKRCLVPAIRKLGANDALIEWRGQHHGGNDAESP